MKFSQMYFVLMLIFHDCDARIIDQSGSSSSSSEKWGKTLKYHIKDPLRKDEYSKNISTAVDDFKKNVNCMKFEEVKDGDDVDLMSSEYILFEDAGPGSGCHSQVGRQRGRRPVRINLDVSRGCTDLAIIKQQMMHSLGLGNSHLEHRLYTPPDNFSILHHHNDLSISDIINLNLHFSCCISPDQFSRYMDHYEHNIHQEMMQLDVVESENSEQSLLLFPDQVLIELSEVVEEMYPGVAGEYRKVAGDIRHSRPVWRHKTKPHLKIVYDGVRWRVEDDTDDKDDWLVRSRITSKNMMIEAEDWEYYDHHQNKWVENTFRDVNINLFPQHNAEQDAHAFEQGENQDDGTFFVNICV